MLVRAMLILALAVSTPAFAQSPAIPRTPEGKPDFQGVWQGQTNTPMERFPGASGLHVPAAEATAFLKRWQARLVAEPLPDPDFLQQVVTSDETPLARIDGQFRSSQIIDPPDGKLPFTAKGRRLATEMPPLGFGFEGPEQRTVSDRCLSNSGRTPLGFVVFSLLRRIVQTGEALVIHSEMQGEIRIIHIGGGRTAAPPPSIAGHSRGRWEGDTLVVETSGLRGDRTFQRMTALPMLVGPETRVTEWFMFEGADELLYRYTLEDPDLYERPWTVEAVMRRSDEPMFESACHEGNYGMTNMLLGARIAEERASKSAGNGKP